MQKGGKCTSSKGETSRTARDCQGDPEGMCPYNFAPLIMVLETKLCLRGRKRGPIPDVGKIETTERKEDKAASLEIPGQEKRGGVILERMLVGRRSGVGWGGKNNERLSSKPLNSRSYMYEVTEKKET